MISVNGQDRIDRTAIPGVDQVLAKLLGDLAAQFAPRYSPPPTEVEIPLAVGEELRSGNKLAKEGDLAGAAKLWEAASMQKAGSEGDRIHNLGATHEMQAYAKLSGNPRFRMWKPLS